jgi:hypothetical protein
MKNCPQCGNLLDDAQNFCTRCGNQLTASAPPVSSSSPLPPPPPAGAGAPPPPVATPAYSPPAEKPSVSPLPPSPPPKKSKWWVWLIVALSVIGLIVGLVIWVASSTRRMLLESTENMKEEISEITISPTPTAVVTATPTSTPTPTPTATPVPQTGPEVVVENFLNSSLGTLPGSRVDYDKAWTYLGNNLKALYPDGSYLPLLLCIQDGPSAVDISEPAFMDMAYVNVLANYGGSWINMWEFELQEIGGLWQIEEIRCLSQ